MSDPERTTIGALPEGEAAPEPPGPRIATWVAWVAFAASLAVLAAHLAGRGPWRLAGLIAVDGLTVALWPVITFISGVVHSYSRRYMAGSKRISRFFAGLVAFTIAAGVLVAADHVLLFAAAWLAMGLLVADLIGYERDREDARNAAKTARRSFLATTLLVGLGAGLLAWSTSATTISSIVAQLGAVPRWAWMVTVVALGLAAVIQSALVPFHTWLLSSMTAPTPASAIMHAGFVNAGGILLARFAPVFTLDGTVLILLAVVGAISALLGKMMRAVQADVKGQLGSSTVGQMGFMVMQAGLGFFAAAITHLTLHGFYKAYRFLSSSERIDRRPPTEDAPQPAGPVGGIVAVAAALAGGALFVWITGKGLHLDAGLLLTGLVVLTTFEAARSGLRSTDLPARWRYGALPLVFLPAIAAYGLVYNGMRATMAGVPAITSPAPLTAVHAALAAAFLIAYLAMETGAHRHSRRLYVWLLNRSQPKPGTVLAEKEDHDDR